MNSPDLAVTIVFMCPPQTLSVPAGMDNPNGRAFELTQHESFGLHIWLAERSFHGFESAFLQLGVTTVVSRIASYITKPFV